MLNWDDLKYLLAVGRAGTISGAADRLGVNYATVTRRIRGLEERLDTHLFERHEGNHVLTSAGEVAFKAAERMEAQSIGVERQVLGQAQDLSGVIRVTAPEAIGRSFLLPAVREFNSLYPDIVIELSLSMRPYDLGMREADIAFRVTDNPPEDLVGTRLATVEVGVYTLLGDSLDPRDVDAVISIEFISKEMNWEQEYFPQAKVTLVTDSPTLAADAIKEGFGVSMIPVAIGGIDPLLERMRSIPIYQGQGFWLLTHLDVRSNARMRLFRDFMQEHYAAWRPQVYAEELQGDVEEQSKGAGEPAKAAGKPSSKASKKA
ncbi:MAG: LysR family transcriptional regulator [Pseudomonadota bacterium]